MASSCSLSFPRTYFSRLCLLPLLLGACPLHAQTPAPGPVTIQIDAAKVIAHLNPGFYGLMTEEINHSYDGGLYAELIANRVFEDGDAKGPVNWSLDKNGEADAAISVDTAEPLSAALPKSLRLHIGSLGHGGSATLSNEGFWGVPIMPHTTYKLSFYARTADGFSGSVKVSLQSGSGWAQYTEAEVPLTETGWHQYSTTLTTGDVKASAHGRFSISVDHPGTVWFNLVSLFPPTYHDRANGNRLDLMELLAGLKPSFLRLPGGNYLEGNTIDTRFAWKKTLGPLVDRPGHMGCWSYRSSDGLGLLEYLEWCEDLNMEPLLAVYAGYSLRQQHVNPGPDLEPYVQEALEEIEYVTGDQNTTWGKKRAQDGHPRPFPLHNVEIGNEDAFDHSGTYEQRFAQIFDAIRAKYPDLKLIATKPVTTRKPDFVDDHAYRSVASMEHSFHDYDAHDRTGPKIFVGEWATTEGSPTPYFSAALGDACYLAGLEHNADLVRLESYAPLLCNVNPGATQWRTNLIGYDSLASFGSPSYYVQKMFSGNHGEEILQSDSGAADLPCTVMHDPASNAFYLHVVNTGTQPIPAAIQIKGATAVGSEGKATTLTAEDGHDQNSVLAPEKAAPREAPLSNAGPSFSYTFPPHSVTVLAITGK